MGRRAAVGVAAVSLSAAGVFGLGLRDDETVRRESLVSDPTPTVDASTPQPLPSSTSVSVGGRRITRSTLSPPDTWPPVSVSPPVAPPPPIDLPVVETAREPSCSTVRLTVLAIDGCPNTSSLLGVVAAITQEAAALPE